MPPLYNAYGAEVLRSKFYKDKPQNGTPETDLVEAWLIWNLSFTAILLNLESHLAISFSQFGIPSGDSFFNQHEKRGPIWRPSNSETWDPFWRSPLIKLGIPSGNSFYSNEIWGPIWRPPNSEIRDPFWRSPSTWNPIWRFLLFNR